MLNELKYAYEALSQYRHEESLRCFKSVLIRPDAFPEDVGAQSAFIAAVIKFADIALLLGKELETAIGFLERGLQAAEQLGDQRNHILIQLTMGHVLLVLFRHQKAFSILAEGTKRARELGDADIINQTSMNLGLFYFIQGRHVEALEYSEKSLKSLYDPGVKIFKALPVFIAGLSAAYLGQFHRSIGILDFHCHFARQNDYFSMTSGVYVPRAALGMALELVGKSHEARFHLEEATKESEETGNLVGLLFSLRGLAFHHYRNKNLKRVVECLAKIWKLTGEDAPFSIVSPWILEMYHEVEKRGYGSDIGWRFKANFEAFLKSPNVHMKGVGWRLRALDAKAEGENVETVLGYLSESETCLRQSGDTVQLAKTRIEMARLNLLLGNRKESYYLAMNARKGIAGYNEDIFPKELQDLLGNHYPTKSPVQVDEQLDRIFTLFRELGPAVTGRLPEGLLPALSRFFKAERSALFLFDSEKEEPELLTTYHLSAADISSSHFDHSRLLVEKAFRENRAIVSRNEKGFGSRTGRRLSVLCLPFDAGNKSVGVIYHDNVYLMDGFHVEEGVLQRLSDTVSEYIRQDVKYTKKIKAEQSVLKKSIHRQGKTEDFVFPTPDLQQLGEMGRKVAGSDATVLIYGETGTGKEVLARWLHEKSFRRENPFIVVEPTAIPPTLIESDLFGHEKGAFTGADRQKIGRIELAHRGTLFIDEIGEIPDSVQVKLLRVLEQKSISRLGGYSNIRSDFRLLVATNRNLAEEVRKNRFREDLYFRLNVIEMTMPVLRERREDIPLLARHFLRRFARKYNRLHLDFSEADLTRLKELDWPGNVRELRNVIERAVLLSGGDTLELDFPVPRENVFEYRVEDLPSMDEMQRRYIRAVLEKTEGKISGPGGAIEILGMKRTTFNARLKKLGLR